MKRDFHIKPRPSGYLDWWDRRRVSLFLKRVQAHLNHRSSHPSNWEAIVLIDRFRRNSLINDEAAELRYYRGEPA